MRQKDQAEIFTRFYREPEVHDQPGVGIGLYLARKIIELQNGYIEIQSEIGNGSCFCLYFSVENEEIFITIMRSFENEISL